MQVNIKQAIRLFFSNPSLDMVFIEAIANSLDADASKISICINPLAELSQCILDSSNGSIINVI